MIDLYNGDCLEELKKMEFRTSNVHLIKGDCLEVMPKIDSNIVSLIVTDPPYGMDYKSNRRV